MYNFIFFIKFYYSFDHFFLRHNGPVWQLSWAHPKYGNILASCGFDKKVSVWKETKPGEWNEVISHSEHQGSGIKKMQKKNKHEHEIF